MAIAKRIVAIVLGAFVLGFVSQNVIQVFNAKKSSSSTAEAAREHSDTIASSEESLERLQEQIEGLKKALGSRTLGARTPKAPMPPQIDVVGMDEILREMKVLEHNVKVSSQRKRRSLKGAPTNIEAPHTSTHAPPLTIAPKLNHLLSLPLTKCVDANPSFMNNTMRMYSCNSGRAQNYWATPEGLIKQSHYSLCVYAPLDGQAAVVPCTGAEEQKWDLVSVTPTYAGPGGTPIRNRVTGQCLTVGADEIVVSRPCDGSCFQQWVLSSIPNHNHVTHVAPMAQNGKRDSHGIKILCWILTQPSAHATLIPLINNTWGRECEYLLFVSSEGYPGVNMIVADIGQPESRKILWLKTQHAWMYIYQNYIDKADWFWKADDDTYTRMDELRKFAAARDTEFPAHYGRRLQYGGWPTSEFTFVSGGSGMLLSRGAVRMMGQKVLEDPKNWGGPINGPADLLTSRTLWKIGITAYDTRDELDRHRFIVIGLDAEHVLTRAKQPEAWVWKYSNDTKEASDCCSDNWIATHYVKEAQMYALYNMEQLRCKTVATRYPYLK